MEKKKWTVRLLKKITAMDNIGKLLHAGEEVHLYNLFVSKVYYRIYHRVVCAKLGSLELYSNVYAW